MTILKSFADYKNNSVKKFISRVVIYGNKILCDLLSDDLNDIQYTRYFPEKLANYQCKSHKIYLAELKL